MKKKSFTLIEITIALGLLTLLLTFFAFWNSYFARQKKEIREIAWESNQVRYFHQRLSQIFPNVELPFFKGNKENLIFYFDRGIAKNPLLAGKVLGHIYLDTAGNLTLGIWPCLRENTPIYSPCEKIVLLSNISKIAFSFYNPPDPNKLDVSPDYIGNAHPKEGWQNHWSRKYEALSAFVKIEIMSYNETISNEYVFDLGYPIVYPTGDLK